LAAATSCAAVGAPSVAISAREGDETAQLAARMRQLLLHERATLLEQAERLASLCQSLLPVELHDPLNVVGAPAAASVVIGTLPLHDLLQLGLNKAKRDGQALVLGPKRLVPAAEHLAELPSQFASILGGLRQRLVGAVARGVHEDGIHMPDHPEPERVRALEEHVGDHERTQTLLRVRGAEVQQQRLERDSGRVHGLRTHEALDSRQARRRYSALARRDSAVYKPAKLPSGVRAKIIICCVVFE